VTSQDGDTTVIAAAAFSFPTSQLSEWSMNVVASWLVAPAGVYWWRVTAMMEEIDHKLLT